MAVAYQRGASFLMKNGNTNSGCLKILALSFSIILLIGMGFRYTLTTDFALEYIENNIEKKLTDELSKEVEIENVSGDAWKHLILEQIKFTKSDYELSIDKISLTYSFFDFILGTPEIDSIFIDGVDVELTMDKLNDEFFQHSIPNIQGTDYDVHLRNIEVTNSTFRVNSSSYLPDSSISIKDVAFQGSLKNEGQKSINIHDLSFKIEYGRLPQTLVFGLDGSITDDQITLDELLLGVGESIIEGRLGADLNSNVLTGNIGSDKINLNDFIQNFSKDSSELEVELGLEGSDRQLKLSLFVNGPNIQNVDLSVDIIWQETPIIQRITLYAEYFDVSDFMDSSNISGGPLELEIKGDIYGLDTTTTMIWLAELSDVELDAFRVKNIKFNGELEHGETKGKAEILSDKGELLRFSFQMDSSFSESPNWNVDYLVQDLNLNSIHNGSCDGNVHFSGKVSGTRFVFPESLKAFIIHNQNPNTGELMPWYICNEVIDEITFDASIYSSQLETTGFIRIKQSKLEIEAQANNPFHDTIEYGYRIHFDDLNIGDLTIFEGNTTRLSGQVFGNGKGNSVETATIHGVLESETSQINNANIESFNAEILYRNGMMMIQDGTLKSEIADGNFSGKRDLMDVKNPENRLNMNINIKNPQPLAKIFGLKSLVATGNLDGIVQQNDVGFLLGNFDLNLSNVEVDSIFSAKKIQGISNIEIKAKTAFETNLEITEPFIKNVRFQDVNMKTKGSFTEDSLLADFEISIAGSEKSTLFQEGRIVKDISQKISNVSFTRFDFLSQESNFSLEKPFNIRFLNSDFGTDTLHLISDADASFKFVIPNKTNEEILAHFSGENFEIGLLQEITLGEKFLEGTMSGAFNYHQTPGDVVANGLLRLDDIDVKGANVDSLIFSIDIINERLDARGNIFWDSTLGVAGWANVPFVVNKEELDKEFYNRPVRGGLDIQPTDLSRFENVLKELGIINSGGIALLKGVMSGKAGAPKFYGVVEVDDPKLSGVPVDQLTATFDYSDEEKKLMLKGEIFEQNTSVAQLDIAYPLDYDFRTFDLYLPTEEDQLSIIIETNNLDIALFNDFVNPAYIRSMSGEINADLEFIGPMGSIKPSGNFNLRNGTFTSPYSGIDLQNLIMQIDVDNGMLDVSQIYAESGNGNLMATGNGVLSGITPKNLLLDVVAKNFKLIDKPEVTVDVDLDATLSGELEQPHLIGDLVVNDGYYIVENFGDQALENIELSDEQIKSFVPFDSLSIDMIIEFGDQFYVRSFDYLDLELELFGLLDLKKERNNNIELFGELSIDEGFIRPLGKQFDVASGTIAFSGAYNDPELIIKSSYTPQTRQKGESVELFYSILGTHLNPDFMFESTPEMEQSNVICYTLFNKPCYSLDNWQSVFVEDSEAQEFQALKDVLIDQVETLATRQLGVDVVQIDNSGQNGRTAITTGWYINERTLFSIINELTSSTPKTLFVLEYLLNENWDLIITQGEDSRQGIDLRYQYDY